MSNAIHNPADSELQALLAQARNLAIVGLSPKPQRPSFMVANYMQQYGYNIIPVRPAANTILDQPVYKRLEDVPMKVDIAVIFRAADKVDEIVTSCIDCGIAVMWLQEGIVNMDAAARARDAGITVIMDLCIYKACLKLCRK